MEPTTAPAHEHDPQSQVGASDAVCTSFALGWQMARLYERSLGLFSEPRPPHSLPELRQLAPSRVCSMYLDEIEVGLGRLAQLLENSPDLPDASELRPLFAREDADRGMARARVVELHVDVLTTLIAADVRCGTAYRLGRALADICASPLAINELSEHIGRLGSAELQGWLSDLNSALPDHVGSAVALSCERWTRWGTRHPSASLGAEQAQAAGNALHQQGKRWRALLSGVTGALDVLGADDYTSAARRSLGRRAEIWRGAALRLVAPLVVSLALLVVGMILAVGTSGAARAVVGLGMIVTSAAIAWKTVSTASASVIWRVDEPVWNAVLDEVVADRITELPASQASDVVRAFGVQAPVDDTTVIVPAARLSTLSDDVTRI